MRYRYALSVNNIENHNNSKLVNVYREMRKKFGSDSSIVFHNRTDFHQRIKQILERGWAFIGSGEFVNDFQQRFCGLDLAVLKGKLATVPAGFIIKKGIVGQNVS
jgi:hypothetical protein